MAFHFKNLYILTINGLTITETLKYILLISNTVNLGQLLHEPYTEW